VLYFNEGKRKYVHFEKDSNVPVFNDFADLITKDGKCTHSETALAQPIDPNQSSAFIDIDADCRNDILIQSGGKLEVWRGRLIDDKIKYCLTKSSYFDIDKTLGHFVLADIDRDGLLDIVFPVEDSTKLLIGYNKVPFDYDWSADYCETHIMNDLTVVPDVFDDLLINLNSQVNIS
jgi:hypothetical protein